jgi:predicted nucleotidyltransferase
MQNEKRKALFRYLLLNPAEASHVRKTAKALKLAPGFVSVFVKSLGAIVKGGSVDISSPQVRSWKITFNIETISPILKELRSSTGARAAGLFGSWAKGSNLTGSDIDIWFLVDKMPSSLQIAKTRDIITRKIGAQASPLFLTKERAAEMRSADPSFYFSLRDSFVLWGDGLD